MFDAVMQQLAENGTWWARGAAALVVLGAALLLSSICAAVVSRLRRAPAIGGHVDLLDELPLPSALDTALAPPPLQRAGESDGQVAELVEDLGRRLDRLEAQLDGLAARAEGARPGHSPATAWTLSHPATRRESAEAAQLRLAARR